MKKFFLLFGLLGVVAYGSWHYRDYLTGLYYRAASATSTKAKPVPDPERYEELKESLKKKRSLLAQQYQNARTAAEISQVHNEARDTLESALPDLMRCWLGTDWDFNGTSQTPGEGKIACGYFVSTIMRDAGFRVERIRLAQQPSQNIIETFLTRDQMHIRAGLGYGAFLKEVVSRGPGIRIVGLDRHVAFLVVDDDGEVRFIHSSGGPEKSVVDQSREHAATLRNSRYRVTGNITASDEVIHQWLTEDFWKTVM